eukprot:TRINITY_DN5141_c0_g1_i1.p1 TRINITY_DN5141_c0_g1~~TRINITY_DN5141_c0_g1_i1.p1  ORF type:complete len:444 (+),score=121.66 TRINITY_DN5141_c0_g1_i1:170-1501(+)
MDANPSEPASGMDSVKQSMWSSMEFVGEKAMEFGGVVHAKTSEWGEVVEKYAEENDLKGKSAKFGQTCAQSVSEGLTFVQKKAGEWSVDDTVTANDLDPAEEGEESEVFSLILGVAQDAGYPHPGCHMECCRGISADKDKKRVSSVGVVDSSTKQRWLLDCSPDIKDQLRLIDRRCTIPERRPDYLAGVFLTHGHTGHYSGLTAFGKEAMNTKDLPVYVMPRMAEFIGANKPWSTLVKNGNIKLIIMQPDIPVQLNERLSLTPFLVPHRDEDTETVGFRVEGPARSLIYIPDIDSWDQWGDEALPGAKLVEVVEDCDYALLDGTFFDSDELSGGSKRRREEHERVEKEVGGDDSQLGQLVWATDKAEEESAVEEDVRTQDEVPHPPIADTMQRLSRLPEFEKKKVKFLHLNHTNPALKRGTRERQAVYQAGHSIAREGAKLYL